MEGVATLPDGTKKWLLLINNWDFNWQGDYRYSIPPTLPRGTKLSMRFTYDNSTNNVQNPNDPPRPVRYGPQSSDEMAELWVQLLPVRRQETRLLEEAYAAKMREAAIQCDEFLLRLDPNNVEVHTKLGFIRFLEGKPDVGIEHLHKAIALDPKSDTPHYKLGLILKYQKRVAEAKAEFDLALKLNPRNYDAHGNLGVIFAEEGKLELAEQHLRAALAINPDDPIARDLLGELMKAKGRGRE
jgi:tetratricopeptide (TPR) repeat protein